MHPAFALTRTRLAETRLEFDEFLEADKEQLKPLESNTLRSAGWTRTVARASGVEGVYTGIENVLKTVLTVTDGGVFASGESYHAQLLAQAAQNTDKREPVVGQELYGKLDELRSFRHRERINYRHVLKEDLVNKNVLLLKDAFPQFESEVTAFIESWERRPRDHETPTSSHTI